MCCFFFRTASTFDCFAKYHVSNKLCLTERNRQLEDITEKASIGGNTSLAKESSTIKNYRVLKQNSSAIFAKEI